MAVDASFDTASKSNGSESLAQNGGSNGNQDQDQNNQRGGFVDSIVSFVQNNQMLIIVGVVAIIGLFLLTNR